MLPSARGSVALGLLYPGYMSFKAVKRMDAVAQQTWLKYWLVLSVMAFVGLILDVSPLYYRLPLYLWIKIAVVAYLVHPQTLGYKTVYEKVLEPHLSAQAQNIDQAADTIKREIVNQANTLAPRVNQFVNQGRDVLQRRLSTMQGKPPGRPKTT